MNSVLPIKAHSFLYQKVARPILFRIDPEKVHNYVIKLGKKVGRSPLNRRFIPKYLAKSYSQNRTRIFGKTISSPIMLSAGFDKNAELVKLWPNVGFGGAEIGTVTMRPYAGNSGKRLTRLPEQKGILVNYGLASLGAEKVLKNFKARLNKPDFLWGISIAPTNDGQKQAISDLIQEYAELYPQAAKTKPDYITLNISCPNTSCGQPFLESNNLQKLLEVLDAIKPNLPTAIKLSPDLPNDTFTALLKTAAPFPWIKAIIVSNLTKTFDKTILPEGKKDLPGGLSGPLVKPKMLQQLRLGRSLTGKRFTWIACGGISSAADVQEAISSGATAVQLITAMIYQGPTFVAVTNAQLAKRVS